MNKKLAHEYNELIRNELINRRVGEPVNKKALDKLLDLFLKCNIESFYKFKSLKSSHTLTNFRDDIFHFSLVKDLNDPREFAYSIDIEKERRERAEVLSMCYFIEEPTEEEISEFVNVEKPHFYNDVKQFTLVHSLTTTYNNAPMWAAYADEENGICIEYDAKDILSRYGYNLAPVEYTDDIPSAPYSMNFDEIIKFLHRICLTKKSSWSYEQEWRVVAIQYNNKCSEKNDKIKPKGVIIGNAVPEKTKMEILDICSKKGIIAYELMYDEKSYDSIKKRIN